MNSPRTWVLVADGGTALVFRNTGHLEPHRSVLEAVPDGAFHRKPGRLHLGAKPSKAFASAAGNTQHMISTHERQSRRVEEEFVQGVVAWLAEPRQASRFDHLIVIAPPRTLGEVRASLPSALATKLSQEISADLVKSPIKEIESHVASYLKPTHAVA